MSSTHGQREAERRSALGAGLLGGFVGASLLLGVVTIAKQPGPNAALASPDASIEERPRGLISAADQRKQIIERMDRILVVLERIESLQRGSSAERPPTRTR